jgi:UDP-N-acetylmuramoyl-L-alanyl-D-glutamate--2,6-diaminopimelate ligase
MKLKEILYDMNVIFIGDENKHVTGVSYDSRTINKNYAFFVLPKGDKYINEALAKGASVIIATLRYNLNATVTQIIVDDIFRFMSIFCARFYNYPDKELSIIGVTGTNGKTTITYMIESIFAKSEIECGVIGTINYRYNGKVIEAINTTPQSLDIYKIMRNMVDRAIKYLVMEVSSHALSLGRVYGIDFNVAVFTNLTREHLDFHKNMNNYFLAKSILFKNLAVGTKYNKKYAVINVDDKYGQKLLKIGIDANIKGYSAVTENIADFKAEDIEITNSESNFDAIFNNEKAKVNIKHIGMHNVYNALAALAATVCCGISLYKAVDGLNSKHVVVPGRLERIDIKNLDFDMFVDYAHTDDALKNVLGTIKKMKHKRIITIFGCGGDRDRTKRSLMGKIAVTMSDFVFVTSDNPRTENPDKIILDIEAGIKKVYKTNYKVVADREIAIKKAVMMADKGDILLLAGRGHEIYQIVGTRKIYFSDVKISKKYLAMKEHEKIFVKQLQNRRGISSL